MSRFFSLGNLGLLQPYVCIQELHGSSLWFLNIALHNCLAHLSLLNTSHTQTSVLQHGFPYLFFIYFGVFLKMTLVHTYMINCQGTRFPTVFCHFMCPTPFSTCYASAAETYLMAAHILEVHHVWLTLCWTLKWEMGRHAIQTTQAISQLSLYLLGPFFLMYSF